MEEKTFKIAAVLIVLLSGAAIVVFAVVTTFVFYETGSSPEDAADIRETAKSRTETLNATTQPINARAATTSRGIDTTTEPDTSTTEPITTTTESITPTAELHTTTTEPVTATTEPVTTPTEPITTTTEPISTTTKPTTTATQPITSTTEPIATTTEPVTTTTEPITTTTEPVTTTAEPITTTTEPVTTTKEPITTTTEPITTATQPITSATEPITTTTEPIATTTGREITTTEQIHTTTEHRATTSDDATTSTESSTTAAVCESNEINRIICATNNPVTISCEQHTVINIKAGIWGRTVPYEQQCYCSRCEINNDCVSDTSDEIIGLACNGITACTFARVATAAFGGDPCPGTKKYLNVTYTCIRPDCATNPITTTTEMITTTTELETTTTDGVTTTMEQPTTTAICESNEINRIICAANEPVTISCEQNTVINIKAGIWGRTVPYEEQCYCDGCVVDTNCVSEASDEIISTTCNGITTCTLASVTSAAFGGNPCVNTKKYLNVTYTCMRPECITNPIITTTEMINTTNEHESTTTDDVTTTMEQPTTTAICESNEINRIICATNAPLTISCEQQTVINIKAGIWGRTVPYEEQCYNANSAIDTNCVSEASDAFISMACNGNSACTFASVVRDDFGGDPCPGVYKYLNITYTCVRPDCATNPVITTTEMITTTTEHETTTTDGATTTMELLE